MMLNTLVSFGGALMALGLVGLIMKTRTYQRVMTIIIHAIVGKLP